MSQDSTTATAVETGNLDRDALLMRFIKSIVDERYEQIVKAADARRLAEYAEKDTTTVKPKFGDLVLGTRTVAEPKDKLVVADDQAFEAWAESGNHGTWKFIVDPTWKTATLRYARWDEENQVAVTKTGEVIPGVMLQKAPPPSTVTQKPNPEAFAKLAEMLREGQFTADLRALVPSPKDDEVEPAQ
ncbi:hypothetical protein GTY75_08615 [Streptomyces sp. SID8381]|uniref:hypothetical protein n=1 Tax=unclassified Streptomyces TaxID=2593676 RepID=UPI00037A4146|nr:MULTISPECIES: hypothetical protein [unclassified Streptomyces]MYX26730.1 hypothetical protein [Streptomyces sp. SID8381]